MVEGAPASQVVAALPAVLDEASYERALQALAKADLHLAKVLEEYGRPPMWEREPGFSTLVRIILEQQVSLASARASYERLLALVSPLTPQALLALDDAALKAAGFSRQKAAYARMLAAAIVAGEIDLEALAVKDDEMVRAELTKLKGIGRWSADIYLLMALLRPDAWPKSDLALANAVQQLKGLAACPSFDEMEKLAEAWQPWRAVAARLLWHFYLSKKGA